LLPSLLLAYYIYRYRYLELIIEESLIVASFAAVVLIIYIYGIKTIGDWMTLRYGIRPGVVEALLILVLALAAAPLRRWLEKRFHKLFEREGGALSSDCFPHQLASWAVQTVAAVAGFCSEQTTRSPRLAQRAHRLARAFRFRRGPRRHRLQVTAPLSAKACWKMLSSFRK